MKQKSTLSFLICIIFLFCGCQAVSPIELPERMPAVTPAPEPTPTPEPTPELIDVPENLEELSELIGVDVYAPDEPLPSMQLSSLGYDGEISGALKYTANDAYLLYTVTKGIAEPAFTDCFKITVSGIEISVTANPEQNLFDHAYWIKNGNTYCLFAEPVLNEDEMSAAVSAMITAPQNSNAPSVETESIAELSAFVNFTVNIPQNLPEKYTLAHAYALYGQIPVQIYSNGSTEITFVKSEGTLLPPRFSKIEYASGGEYTLPDGSIAQLYYTENGVSLAEWTSGGYGYSISVTDPNGNPLDLKKKSFLSLIDGFYEKND